MPRTFENRTVIITGAGKGLGRAYARHLAGLGACLVVNNRSHAEDKLSSADQVVSEIQQAGGQAVADYSSVEDPSSGAHLLKTALDAFGRLDGVIVNAGISEGCTFRKQRLEDFRRVMDINLMGSVNVLHPTFSHLYDQRYGSIVLSTSVAGLYGEHGLPAYSASKAALLGLMYSLSKEGAVHGIRVNALAPYAATQMTDDQLTPALGELMQATRVAPVAAWLLSEDCTVNGETLVSGANRISRARVCETEPAFLPTCEPDRPVDLEATWQSLQSKTLENRYAGALDHFRQFIASTQKP